MPRMASTDPRRGHRYEKIRRMENRILRRPEARASTASSKALGKRPYLHTLPGIS